jgi:ketosteroid isomerase-like protein
MDLEEVVAREEIRDLVSRYTAFGDRGRLADMAALFAPDGVLAVEGEEPRTGPREIQDFLEGVGRSLRDAATATSMHHHVSSVTIELLDADSARSSAYFLVVTDRGPDHWGRYRDELRRGADGWRFARRSVRTDGEIPGSWAAERREQAGG